jgi:hypothetical protein
MDVIILSQENRGHPLPQKIVDRGANRTYYTTTTTTTTNFLFLFLI